MGQPTRRGELGEISNYCEIDVLNTYLIYLRFQLLRGELDAERHQTESASPTQSSSGLSRRICSGFSLPGGRRGMPGEAGPLRAHIIDLTHDGRGVADLDGRRVFVPDALPGELVEIALRKRRRKLQEADLVRVLEPSPERVVPACEYFGRCGGCVLQHLDDAGQVRFKQEVVAQAFARIGGIDPEEWLAPITGPTWRYRRGPGSA